MREVTDGVHYRALPVTRVPAVRLRGDMWAHIASWIIGGQSLAYVRRKVEVAGRGYTGVSAPRLRAWNSKAQLPVFASFANELTDGRLTVRAALRYGQSQGRT